MTTYTKTLTSDAYIWPKETGIGLVCTGRISDQIVDDFGVQIKIREVNKTGFNDYGDATETYTDTHIKAYLHQWMQTDDEVKEGIYINGEIVFVFKLNADPKVKVGNRIFYESEWYKITSVNYQILAGTKYLINARVEKTIQ